MVININKPKEKPMFEMVIVANASSIIGQVPSFIIGCSEKVLNAREGC